MNRYLSIPLIVLFAGLSIYFYSEKQKQKQVVKDFELKIDRAISENEFIQSKLEVLTEFIDGNWSEALEKAKNIEVIEADSEVSLYSFLSSQIESMIEDDSLGNSELASMQYRLKKAQDSLRSSLRIIANRDSSLSNMQSDLENFLENKSGLLASLSDCREQLRTAQNIDTLVFKVSTGYIIRYFGKVNKGMANGEGSGFWPSGGYYHGEWRDNARHGKGKYTWKEGHIYIGDFVNDKRTGKGTYIWSHGERYEGSWSNNLRHGHGVLYHPDGQVKFSGNWENDRPVQ
jgi:hypothetical protein